jgi:hypothetical protein
MSDTLQRDKKIHRAVITKMFHGRRDEIDIIEMEDHLLFDDVTEMIVRNFFAGTPEEFEAEDKERVMVETCMLIHGRVMKGSAGVIMYEENRDDPEGIKAIVVGDHAEVI